MSDQLSFSDAEQDAKRKKTRREVFLDEMEKVVPWAALETVIEPHYPRAGKGRHPYPLRTMLQIHLIQQWYALSDPAMEEALYEISSMRRFARLSLARGTIPDETTILNFRHLLEKHSLAERILEAVNELLVRKGLMLKQGTLWMPPSSPHRARPRTTAARAIRRCTRREKESSGTSG
jgi:IS5 family transposase